MTPRNIKREIATGILILACIVGMLCLFAPGNIPGSDIPDNSGTLSQPKEVPGVIPDGKVKIYHAAFGNITINAPMPESPSSISVYKGVFNEGDYIQKRFRTATEILNPLPEDLAVNIAKNKLNDYGGLPSDAILQDSFIEYAYYTDRQTGAFIRKVPLDTFVSWNREIDGMKLEGSSDTIQVELGENGDLLRVFKRWRTYSPEKSVSIISVESALERLINGNIINPPLNVNQQSVKIEKIALSYYTWGASDPEVVLEPVWAFYGKTPDGRSVPIFVYARQFANFTAAPSYGTAPLKVTFTDTSDASPSKWRWDFGDGTNSTEQNPVHKYTHAGNYNISLTVRNELGSDTKEQSFTVK